jgi:signal transduction histidine kinase
LTPQNKAQIDIIDTGIGIAPQDISRIMSPFVQADDSYSRQYGGSGLGLSIAERWIKYFGGDIKIASKLNSGTCVRLTFSVQSTKDLIKPFKVETDIETAA